MKGGASCSWFGFRIRPRDVGHRGADLREEQGQPALGWPASGSGAFQPVTAPFVTGFGAAPALGLRGARRSFGACTASGGAKSAFTVAGSSA